MCGLRQDLTAKIFQLYRPVLNYLMGLEEQLGVKPQHPRQVKHCLGLNVCSKNSNLVCNKMLYHGRWREGGTQGRRDRSLSRPRLYML